MKEFHVNAENEGQRFDKYLHRLLGESTMSFIYKMLRKKNFVLNDKKADGREILKEGDTVKLFLSDDTYEKFRTKSEQVISSKSNKSKSLGFDLKNNIIYEDENIILIDKPYGVLSQKSKPEDISINELLIDYLLDSKQVDSESLIQYKPSVINRLDRNTSGIIIAAKTLKAARVLSDDLKNRTIKKYYLCVIVGHFNKNGVYKAYLSKDEKNNTVSVTDAPIDKDSVLIETGYECLSYKDDLSCVKVHLITGKSHQIRAHVKHLGFPILGDPKYGVKSINSKYKENRQLLHAYRLEFPKYADEYGFKFSGKSFECTPDFVKKYK